MLITNIPDSIIKSRQVPRGQRLLIRPFKSKEMRQRDVLQASASKGRTSSGSFLTRFFSAWLCPRTAMRYCWSLQFSQCLKRAKANQSFDKGPARMITNDQNISSHGVAYLCYCSGCHSLVEQLSEVRSERIQSKAPLKGPEICNFSLLGTTLSHSTTICFYVQFNSSVSQQKSCFVCRQCQDSIQLIDSQVIGLERTLVQGTGDRNDGQSSQYQMDQAPDSCIREHYVYSPGNLTDCAGRTTSAFPKASRDPLLHSPAVSYIAYFH